ncbi:MAG: hypothetical protein ACLTSG_12515 [Lachnospiraceae bacterium]
MLRGAAGAGERAMLNDWTTVVAPGRREASRSLLAAASQSLPETRRGRRHVVSVLSWRTTGRSRPAMMLLLEMPRLRGEPALVRAGLLELRRAE